MHLSKYGVGERVAGQQMRIPVFVVKYPRIKTVSVCGPARRAAALPSPSSARTASGRVPCIPSGQDHIHLTVFYARVLSLFGVVITQSGLAFTGRKVGERSHCRSFVDSLYPIRRCRSGGLLERLQCSGSGPSNFLVTGYNRPIADGYTVSLKQAVAVSQLCCNFNT